MRRIWGIVPAAGLGTRIQPLAFSKELLPVGTRSDGRTERPRTVCEYLLDRMLWAGATRICFVISPAKTDIMNYFGGKLGGASICYAIQSNPSGLCDSIFTALLPSGKLSHIWLYLSSRLSRVLAAKGKRC